jgi:hypothetical protein
MDTYLNKIPEKEIDKINNNDDIKIHAFIFNWRGQYEKTIKLEKEFSRHVDKLTVINSDDNNKKDHWVNLGDSAYFGDQFSKALEIFDCDNYDLLFHIQADVDDPENDWGSIVNSAKFYYILYNYGVYAPNVDYTAWDKKTAKLDALDGLLYSSNIDVVITTDCSCWFINKEMISSFKNKYLDAFKNNKLGWGACSTICAESFMNKKLVLRDNNFKLNHPKGTSYDSKLAAIKMKEFIWRIKDEKILFYLNNMWNKNEMNRYLFSFFK